MNIYFLPKWYLQDKLLKKYKRLKLIILVFFIMNIILFHSMIFQKSKLESLQNNLMDKRQQYTLKKSKNINQNVKSMDTYLNFFSNFHVYEEFRNVSVENNNIQLEFVGNDSSFSKFIKAVENSNKFTIVNINSLEESKNKDKHLWQIELKSKL
ncbi:hypothetical protein GTH52_02780 [Clostridium tyrobutyricum]|jgi:hypothetical protein|uniref:Type IV pilus biogenesis protein PilN n=1 Tax=Clostridium tyrobutyricum DIVETGP TaxID=1408889 RepID=W6N178_CLOTY|nr:hypothetical protein [Clostridium tyrobutyricum]AND85219.1 hypothetical protein CTK_C19670 [Clostridium tyrobutyricum]ANP69776.1 hypothetical protein BA182_08835 [Clostridium tyrobutyricum]MBV4415222.1 hypothetical protein [Clostridium tyrobutyricum]MBV4420893.1 hypothetical protein [Clostridium tyrobutyricum]MBV4424002.1 hypothetical protein [Clostridium tyrobutyricum]